MARSDGDIWVLQGKIDALEWAFAAPPPWSTQEVIFEGDGISGFPAITMDAEGNPHVLWSVEPAVDQPGTVLYYSHSDQGSWSRPTAVLGAAQGTAQAPALVFAEPFLHAVWSGGPTGTVFHSRAYPDDAYAASGWSVPSTPGKTAVGSAPAIAVDLLGRLHLVYAVPFNEDRGIYYTRTDDNGESWENAIQLFDAVAEDWSSVDHPSLTVDERGTVHVAWIRAPLPGYGLSQGVYYAHSMDRGETWTSAMLLADGAYDWPQVAATLTGQIVVAWKDLTRDIVEYRSSSDYGLSWGYVSQIPGLQAVEGRVVQVQDRTGRLHITALDAQIGSSLTLHHIIYAEGQWSGLDSVELEGVYTPVAGAALSVDGKLGLVDVVGLGSRRGDDGLTPSIWYMRRSIESQTVSEPDFTPVPTSTPTPGPTPLPTATPRPVVNPYPPQPSAPVLTLGPISLPMLAFGGIGIALLLVSVIVIAKIMKR